MKELELIYVGKTKNVYKNSDGNVVLKLKDDATGKNGVFDPGENSVALSIKGLGRESLKLTKYYLGKVAEKGIPTHYIDSDLDEVTMTVKPATVFGKGVEFICRRRAVGSFLKRYGSYANEGDSLDYLVEVTLKDDDRQDPPITKDSLIMLNIMSAEEFEKCKQYTKDITKIINDDLMSKGMELYDIKFEFGKNNGETILIDEISGGCMRVYKGKEKLQPMDLTKLILGK